MRLRRLQRGDLRVHIVRCRRPFDTHGELMILVASRLVRYADTTQRDEGHEDLSVVHEAAKDRDLPRRLLYRAHVDLSRTERTRGQGHHVAAHLPAWLPTDQLCSDSRYAARGIDEEVSHVVAG